jgi:hypothetical protein
MQNGYIIQGSTQFWGHEACFYSSLHYFPAVWFGASYLTAFFFDLYIYEIGVLIVPNCKRFFSENNQNSTCHKVSILCHLVGRGHSSSHSDGSGGNNIGEMTAHHDCFMGQESRI